MKKEFSITIKSLFKTKLKLVILLNFIAIILIFISGYNKLKPNQDETIFIMMSDELVLKQEVVNELVAVTKDYDLRKFNSLGYDHNNSDFGQVLATKGYFGTDLFIFNKELAITFKDMQIFKELDQDYLLVSDNYLSNNEIVYGIQISEEYYVLVNIKSEKSKELLIDLINILVKTGGESFEEKGNNK